MKKKNAGQLSQQQELNAMDSSRRLHNVTAVNITTFTCVLLSWTCSLFSVEQKRLS